MKLNPLNTSDLCLSSSIKELLKKNQKPAYLTKLLDSNINTINDLLWVFPLKVQKAPTLESFEIARPGFLFKGKGKIINIKSRPQFGRKGKGRALLYQIDCVVKDHFSEHWMTLKWFNAYPNQVKSLNLKEEICFQGEITHFQEQNQIISPKINVNEHETKHELLIDYPTVNTVNGKHIKKLVDKIPAAIWNKLDNNFPQRIIKKNNFLPLSECFKTIHGLCNWTLEKEEEVKKRLIYEEFFKEQVKFKARREYIKKKASDKIKCTKKDLDKLKSAFDYELTKDQNKSLDDIISDLKCGHPMMRMLQGDVGCGKTTVAFIAACVAVKAGKQVALMSPTEALTLQHYKNFEKIFKTSEINFEILLGSHSQKHKKSVYRQLKIGSIDLIIGTHSLFQEAVEFKNLVLAIIDEQHKFGVEQRLKLVNKGKGVHTLIMSATPIPRTLSLTHYGDLDISIIKQLPLGRKEIKTRIVEPEILSKYLSFIKTRVEMNEQVYVIAPAIEESEVLDISNVTDIKERYQKLFPHFSIDILHGRLKPYEKDEALNKFSNGDTQILVSTSVIEVGIDVHNATVMSIYNPERFGLSSLHQLRGRVGRGGKPGFCFLINEKAIGHESKQRLKVIESSNDGFRIAEADLEQRGHGDLFGKEQSGAEVQRRIANIIKHEDILYQVCNDLEELINMKDPYYTNLLKHYADDYKVSSTI